MNVSVDLSIVPMGVGLSISPYVAACHEVLEKAGLQARLHAFGTNIEGEWEVVMAAVKSCHERMHQMGAPRIHTTMRLGTRTDRQQTIDDKVESVLRILRKSRGEE